MGAATRPASNYVPCISKYRYYFCCIAGNNNAPGGGRGNSGNSATGGAGGNGGNNNGNNANGGNGDSGSKNGNGGNGGNAAGGEFFPDCIFKTFCRELEETQWVEPYVHPVACHATVRAPVVETSNGHLAANKDLQM